MNLFFRLLWLAVIGRRREPVSALGPCRTPFRVLPSDLDVLRHMNNGMYLSLMDLARVDLMRRAGMLSQLVERGWHPVVTAETIQFRRSLRVFQRFSIVTRVLTWDDRAILVEHAFERGGDVVARALVRARFLNREGGSVPTAEILALAGVSAESPPPVTGRAGRWNTEFAVWQGDATAPAVGAGEVSGAAQAGRPQRR